MRWMRTMLVLVVLPLPAATDAPAQELPVRHALLDSTIRYVAADTLHDVALMRREEGRPVIYYNPRLLARLGPELTRFFLMHERGHAVAGHTSSSALAGPMLAGTSQRLRQELDADCWAANRLIEMGDRDAVDGAVEFFLQLGNRRHDLLHPTGSQRATKLLACLPDSN